MEECFDTGLDTTVEYDNIDIGEFVDEGYTDFDLDSDNTINVFRTEKFSDFIDLKVNQPSNIWCFRLYYSV